MTSNGQGRLRAFRVVGSVTHERLDDEVIAIDLDSGAYFALDDVAADCWSILASGGSLGAAVRAVVDRFVDDLRRAFEQADASVPARDWHLRVARRPLRLRIAGDELGRRLAPALEHLAGDASVAPASLTVSCWDRTATGVPPPPPPWPLDALLPGGRIRGH